MKKYIGLFIAALLILVTLPVSVSVSVYAQTTQVTLPQCSTTIHDKYKAKGPDGAMYPTWHPLVDLANGCFHGHEHGSNPNLFYPNGALPKYRPVYGYTMPSEAHAGFKTYVIDLDATHKAMITHHFGTSNAVNAVCNRFHTFDLMLIDSTSGELLSSTYMHGDFGKPVPNETPGIVIKNTCVDKAVGSNGVRQFPIVEPPYKNIGYEPWRLHRDHGINTNPAINAYGFDSAAITINTLNPRTACDTITCTTAIPRLQPTFNIPALGNVRFVEFPYIGFGFTGIVSGTFTVHGLINYIKPNWSYRAPSISRCFPVDTFNYPYICKNIGIDHAPFFKNVFITENN